MYRCKECGCEYTEKPEFCDCGNDEFETVEQKEIPAVKPDINIPEKTIKTETVKTKEKIYKKSFSEQYPALSRFFRSIDPVSGGIFILCIILSFYVIFFAWNPKETDTQNNTPVKTESKIKKPIPNINTFWDNTLPVIKSEPKPIKQEQKKEEQPVIKIVPKPETKITKVPLTKIPVKKPSIKNTNNNTKPKTQVTPASKTQKTQVNTQTVTQTQTAKATKTDAQIAAEKAAAAQKEALAKKELNIYKVNLRNTIGKKIDFTKVIGDGSCTVSFKIDSSGKLVNRTFSKQSSNITLNDAVYAAVMSTPSFNPPPQAYKNETLKLNISFYNGNFEVTLK